jgi:hypothetical protein
LSPVEYMRVGQTRPQAKEGEVALDQLWFALSPQEQVQFGGHFARMLLKAAEQMLTTPCESAPTL